MSVTLIVAVVFSLAFVAAVVAAYIIGQRYSTTSPRSDRIFTAFNNVTPAGRKGPTLSIVIPCYNEQDRLPPMLEETIAFCNRAVARCTDDDTARTEGLFADYELIVVDDCSKDGTKGVVAAMQKKYPTVKLLLVALPVNHGKGFAVRSGFFAASGDYVLMADGDGATKIDDVSELFKSLRKLRKQPAASGRPAPVAPVISVGSRAHLEGPSMAQRTLFRTLLMKVFHAVVNVTYFAGTRGRLCRIKDTQCGFKLFDRRVTEVLFLNNRLERWAFDVELLICAARLQMRVAEVAVNWAEIPGSKVNLRGMVQMGLECLLMCFTYAFGLWPIREKQH